jgi:DNA-binding NarL/FixJ family response regulator
MAYWSKSVLTARQSQIARLVATGMTNPEVAKELGIRQSTVGSMLHEMFLKLRVKNRIELTDKVQEAARRQLTT